jgi:hypothetical protein
MGKLLCFTRRDFAGRYWSTFGTEGPAKSGKAMISVRLPDIDLHQLASLVPRNPAAPSATHVRRARRDRYPGEKPSPPKLFSRFVLEAGIYEAYIAFSRTEHWPMSPQ